jgi:hypothetical protein
MELQNFRYNIHNLFFNKEIPHWESLGLYIQMHSLEELKTENKPACQVVVILLQMAKYPK